MTSPYVGISLAAWTETPIILPNSSLVRSTIQAGIAAMSGTTVKTGNLGLPATGLFLWSTANGGSFVDFVISRAYHYVGRGLSGIPATPLAVTDLFDVYFPGGEAVAFSTAAIRMHNGGTYLFPNSNLSYNNQAQFVNGQTTSAILGLNSNGLSAAISVGKPGGQGKQAFVDIQSGKTLWDPSDLVASGFTRVPTGQYAGNYVVTMDDNLFQDIAQTNDKLYLVWCHGQLINGGVTSVAYNQLTDGTKVSNSPILSLSYGASEATAYDLTALAQIPFAHQNRSGNFAFTDYSGAALTPTGTWSAKSACGSSLNITDAFLVG